MKLVAVRYPADAPTRITATAGVDSGPPRVVIVVRAASLEARHPAGYPDLPTYGGFGDRPYPNIPRISQRAYGHRVGYYRLMSVLDEFGIPYCVAIDAVTGASYPDLIERAVESGATFMAAGISESRPITNAMTVRDERAYIHSATSAIARLLGRRPEGWMSPCYSASTNTARLLAEAGYRYACDWPNGDTLGTYPGLTMYSLPVCIDLDDEYAFYEQGIGLAEYRDRFLRTLAVSNRENSGACIVVLLRPWISGQPFRVGNLRKIFTAMGADLAQFALPGDLCAGVPPAGPGTT